MEYSESLYHTLAESNKDNMKVAAAGPGMNFFLAFITVILIRIGVLIPSVAHSQIFFIFVKS